MAKQEKDAIHSMPNSWREREALRKFEDSRSRLREMLPEIIASNDGEMVKARMAFEEAARGMQLDLRLPSVSGRLHALFDLQVSLDEEIASSNPLHISVTNRVVTLLLAILSLSYLSINYNVQESNERNLNNNLFVVCMS